MTNQCQICGRKLTDDESIARGFGPDCAERRAAFLASCGTTDAEIADLEAAGGDAAKWVGNFRLDMRKGRVRYGKSAIEAARHKAQQERAASVVAVTATDAPVPPEAVELGDPFITVCEIERGGYYVRTPFKLAGFVDAIKRVVGGTWHPEKESWYIPASQITWTIEALEYWFCLPVKVEPLPRASVMFAQPHSTNQHAGLHP